MKLTIKKLLKIIVLPITSIVAVSALAVPPHLPDLVRGGNMWSITAYRDSSPVHRRMATQNICFYYAGRVGTHQRYYWISTTFPNWNGRATQEGDQIFMHGDYANEVGHDAMQWELTTNSYSDRGMGHWQEWREDTRLGRTIVWANTEFQRRGYCRYRSVFAGRWTVLSARLQARNLNGEISDVELVKELDALEVELLQEESKLADKVKEENSNIEPPKDETGKPLEEPLGNL